PRDRHPFPTRRSSDLGRRQQRDETAVVERVAPAPQLLRGRGERAHQPPGIGIDDRERLLDERYEIAAHPGHTGELRAVRDLVQRSEEHTSELQSLAYL